MLALVQPKKILTLSSFSAQVSFLGETVSGNDSSQSSFDASSNLASCDGCSSLLFLASIYDSVSSSN